MQACGCLKANAGDFSEPTALPYIDKLEVELHQPEFVT